MFFTYVARSPAGESKQGTFESRSAEDARQALATMGLTVETVDEVAAAANAPWDSIRAPTPGRTAAAEPQAAAPHVYISLSDTLRLYAGWLLAWYGFVFLVGSFDVSGLLPFQVPYLETLFQSRFILNFAWGTYLFLLLSTLSKWLKGGWATGILFTMLWAVSVYGFVMYA